VAVAATARGAAVRHDSTAAHCASLLAGRLTVGGLHVCRRSQLRMVHKPGGAPLPEDALRICLAAARERLPALVAVAPAGGGGEGEAAPAGDA
jgi:hypothetical protein